MKDENESGSAVATCALCQEQRELEKSHIIPNAFFRRIKPEGKAVQYEPETLEPNRYEQNSWHERLLCGGCEDLISVWERYAVGAIFEPERWGIVKTVGRDLSEQWMKTDYTKFRLFLLSVLFRAGVARGHPYKNVVLTDDETETLRKALLKGTPIGERAMGCRPLVIVYPERNIKLDKLVGGPSFDTVKGCRQYVFVFGGYAWEFYLPKLPLRFYQKGHYLKKRGLMKCAAVSMWDHPIVGNALVTSYEKEYFGLTKLRRDL